MEKLKKRVRNRNKKPEDSYLGNRVQEVLKEDKQLRLQEEILETRARIGGVFGRLEKFFSWRPIFGGKGVKNIPIYLEEKVLLGIGRFISNPIRKTIQVVAKLILGTIGFIYGSTKSGLKEFKEFSQKLGKISSINTNYPTKKETLI